MESRDVNDCQMRLAIIGFRTKQQHPHPDIMIL